MSAPLLSIVTPTHNRPSELRRLLRELNAIEGVEVIVVDDASTETNAALNEGEVVAMPNGRYLRNDVGRRAPYSRNRGAQQARGRHLWFVDDDDVLPRETVVAVARLLSEGEVEIALMSSVFVRNGERIAGYQPSSLRDNFDAYRDRGQLVSLPCVVMSRERFKSAGGWDEAILAGQDTDLLLRLVQGTTPILWPELVVEVHLGDGPRLTNALWKQQRGKLQILKKHWAILTVRRRSYYLLSFVLVMPLLRRLTGRDVAREILNPRAG